MADAILYLWSDHILTFKDEYVCTWSFSFELSFPPVIDMMYGARVLGCLQAFFNPNILDVTFPLKLINRLGGTHTYTYLLDCGVADILLELEEDNVGCKRRHLGWLGYKQSCQ